jgi:hypothetical protein
MCSLGQVPEGLDDMDAKLETVRLAMLAKLSHLEGGSLLVVEGKGKSRYM